MDEPVKVLLVDDEPALLTVIADYLRTFAGMEVTSAKNVDEALSLLRERSFDAVVSDYQMPGKDGLYLLSEVRRTLPGVPFILFTGRGREEVVIEALNRGADYYLQKGGDPRVQFTELTHVVGKAVHERRAENGLKASEGRYRSLMCNLKGVVYRTAFDSYHPERFEGEVEDLTGHDPEAFLSGEVTWDSMVLPEDLHMLAKGRKVMSSAPGRISDIDYRIRRKDGDIRWVNDVGHCAYEDGEPAHILGTIYDITEKCSLQMALEESEERWRFALEGAREGVWDWDVLNDRFYYSPRWKRMLGYDEGDLGTTLEDWWSLVHPLDKQRGELEMARFIKDSHGFFELEHRLRCKDGSYRWILARGKAINWGKDGTPLRIIGTHTDIDQIKRNEELLQAQMNEIRTQAAALQESEETFTSLVRESSDCILLLDGKGRVLEWNESLDRLTGVSGDEARGKRYTDIVVYLMPPESRTPENIERYFQRIAHALETGEGDFFHRPIDTEIMRRDGTRRVVQQIVFPIRVKDGFHIGSIARDVTDSRRVELELKRSRDLYQTMIDKAYDAIFIHDMDGGIMDVNAKMLDMYKVSKEEALRSTIADFSSPEEDMEMAKDIWTRVLQGHDQFFRWKAKRPRDGSIFDVEVYLTKIAFGNKEGVLAHTRDITERLEAEKALRISEERYRTLMDRTAQMLFLHDLDGRILDVNRMVVTRTEYSREELLSMRVQDIDPDSLARDDHRWLWMGAPPYEERVFEVRHRTKDGFVYPVEVHATKVVISGEVYILALAFDITERKRTEEALRQAEERYRHLVENSHDIIYTIQPDGVLTFVSSGWEGNLGHAPSDVVGRNFLDFVHPDDGPAVLEHLKGVMLGGKRRQAIEYRALHQDGSIRWHRSNILPYKEVGDRLAYVGNGVDVTEQRMSTDALAMANRKLNLLSIVTRHDILNQLMAVKGYLELAKNNRSEKEKGRYLDKVTEAADNIHRQIEFTRNYEQLGIKEPVWNSLHAIIDNINAGSLPITISCPEVEIYADPMVETVFANLHDNSLRYAEGATGVRVGCHSDGNALVIIWEDDGLGIPGDLKERIFEHKFGKNTGLGLFLAREVLGMTDISIIETGRPGEGARFEMRVPEGRHRRRA